MVTIVVIVLVALAAGVILYRCAKNAGYDRGSADGYQRGLQAGRKEPLDAIQAKLDEADLDLKEKQAKITAAQRKLDHVVETGVQAQRDLTEDLDRLAPLVIRIDRIKDVKASIASFKQEIPKADARVTKTTEQIYDLQHTDARNNHTGSPKRNLHDAEVEVLSNRKLDYLQQAAELRAQLAAAQNLLIDLIDELAAKRAELTFPGM